MCSSAHYAGDMCPAEAWRFLKTHQNAILVDVRTKPEWTFVGVPRTAMINKKTLFIEWQQYPAMDINAHFIEDLKKQSEVDFSDQEACRDLAFLFLCRSGARSRAAAIAATKAGFKNCYNVDEGFEGDIDIDGHRGLKNGWKAASLPWSQV